MSGSEGPIRRRRIAGEGGPAAPAKKVVAKKASPRKAPVKKARDSKAAPMTTTPGATVAGPAPASRMPAPAKKKVSTPEVGTDPANRWSLPPRRELRWLAPAAIVAIAALVLGALVMMKGIGDRGGDTGVVASDRQASEAASDAAETIFSFRYDKLPEHLSESKALMTPAFAKEFDKIAPALTDLAPQRKIVVQAVSRNSAAVACGDSCSTSKANILVFVDQARLVSGSDQPTVFGNRITVSMVKQDGTWLVNDIRAL